MSDDGGLAGIFKGGSKWLIYTILGSIVLVTVGYLILQSVCKPYYLVGQKLFVGYGSDYLQTITVVNPGPWSTRDPAVEFTSKSGARVVDWSAGVTVETRFNKTVAKMDNGLPAGCIFFVTFSATNTQFDPDIVCDAKTCKKSPTFDADLTFKFIICIGGLFAVGAVVCGYGWIRSNRYLCNEKESTINTALNTLLTRAQAQGDVDKASQTVAGLSSIAEKADIKATPVKKSGDGNNKKKDKGNA